MQLVRRALGAKKNLTLSEVCAYYGLEGGNHRADIDVQATCRLLMRLAGPAPEFINRLPINSV